MIDLRLRDEQPVVRVFSRQLFDLLKLREFQPRVEIERRARLLSPLFIFYRRRRSRRLKMQNDFLRETSFRIFVLSAFALATLR